MQVPVPRTHDQPDGTPTFASPLHWDSDDLDGPGIHMDLNYNPGVGEVHTLYSCDVTVTPDSLFFHVMINDWVSDAMPIGQSSISQAQLNAAGFYLLEDTGSYSSC